jgi:hypothetical protein
MCRHLTIGWLLSLVATVSLAAEKFPIAKENISS